MWTVLMLGLLCTPAGAPAAVANGQAPMAAATAPEARTAEATAQLRAQLDHPLQTVRAGALLSLAQLGDEAVVPRALEWLQSSDLQTRLDALAALAPPALPFTAQAAQAVRAQLADSRSDVRLLALTALKAHGETVAPALLAVVAEDESAAVRVAALEALRPGADPAARHLAVGRLEDIDTGVRFAAIAALGRSQDPVVRPALEHLLRKPEPTVVNAALMALAELADVAAVPKVAALALVPGGGSVSRHAIATLGHLPHPDAAATLTERLHRFGTADQAASEVVAALRRLGPRAEQALVSLVQDAAGVDDRLLVVAVNILAKVGGAASVDPVAALVPRTTTAVVPALSCLRALAERGIKLDAVWLPLVAPALQDPSRTVRVHAAAVEAAVAVRARRTQ